MSPPANPSRRQLRFQSIEEVLRDLERVAESDHSGKLRGVGNWTPGQILTHLAAWIEYGYNGYPLKAPPFFIRWILKWKMKSILEKGMPVGVRIPGIKEGTVGQELADTGEAIERYRLALMRLQRNELCPFESPAFGPMGMDQRIQLNLRHAELHLGHLNLT